MQRTIDFYNKFAEQYVSETKDLDVSSNRNSFLTFIPEAGHILDLGCGSGRDSLFFMDQGYDVTSVDASSEVAKLAGEMLGKPVEILSFHELDYSNTFDGIWACASLLHCPKAEMNVVVHKMKEALKVHGVIYMSFKYGEGERVDERGRFFNDYTEAGMSEMLAGYSDLQLVDMSTESKPLRGGVQVWLNVVVRKIV